MLIVFFNFLSGWSIPVVEHLLEVSLLNFVLNLRYLSIPISDSIPKPIKQLYEDESYFLDYHGFDYEYPWPRE